MVDLYDFKDKDGIKAKLPSLSEDIKFKQIEIIGIDRDILNIKEIIKVEEAKLMLEISQDKELKNQSQRDAKLTILASSELTNQKKELYDLIDKKKRKEAELDYKNTELRINFYYYKDLIGMNEKKDKDD
ncbi:MAG: hypothetical protein EOL97_15245 [Spirochaetia bacterium]|nr:hypothetical protein [Spirochaetia bacterium]